MLFSPQVQVAYGFNACQLFSTQVLNPVTVLICFIILLSFLSDLRRNFSRTSCVSVDIMLSNVVIQLELEFCRNLCTLSTLISRTFSYLGSLIHEHD